VKFGRTVGAAVWVSLCGGTAVPAAAGATPARPHVVFILADDLGYGDIGAYNPDSRIPTPSIDRLAREGIRFTDAHSPASVCTPTRYGILTGRYAWRTWLAQGVVGGYTPPLIEPDRPTVASFLKQNGYTTAMIGKWHLGLGWVRANGFVGTAANAEANLAGSWQDGDPARGMNVDFDEPIRGGPRDLGFDHAYFTAACPTMDGPFTFIRNDRPGVRPDRPIFVDPAAEPEYGRPRPGWIAPGFSLETVDVEFVEEAVAFMERSLAEDARRPFFVYLALSSPHTPWLPPTFARGRSGDGPRGDLVTVADWAVGEIGAALARLGVSGDTLLVFASDNGPHPGTHGHSSAGPFRGYKSHVWEGGHRVPLIARWPGRIPEGGASAEPVELTDLMGTLAGILGRKLSAGAGPDSYDVSPALLGTPRAGPIREAIVSHSHNGAFAIRQGPWKLILGTDGSGGWIPPADERPSPERPGQLYNLEDDPGELANRYAERPEIVARLRDLLASYRESGRSRPPRP
jgi:arylsulfatase A